LLVWGTSTTMYGATGAYGRSAPPRWVRWAFIIVAIGILAIFIVDKLFANSGQSSSATMTTVIGHLDRHDVKRVTIPADRVLIELNDGKTLTAETSADRDLWPAIRRSGADVTIMASGAPSLLRYAVQFTPYLIFALFALFIVRMIRQVRR